MKRHFVQRYKIAPSEFDKLTDYEIASWLEMENVEAEIREFKDLENQNKKALAGSKHGR